MFLPAESLAFGMQDALLCFSSLRVVSGQPPVIRFPASESGARYYLSNFPWLGLSASPIPQGLAGPCSPDSQLPWSHLASSDRSYQFVNIPLCVAVPFDCEAI